MKSAQLGVEDIDCRRCTGTRELENDNSPTQATNQAISDTLLPLELQDYIIDCLAVRRFSPAGYNRYDTEITSALAACTLVCSYWTLRSSKYFLEYINLVEFTDVIDDPLGDFLDDAQQSERLSRNVTMLQLPYKPHDICFHTLFGSLPNLSSLTTTPHWRSGRTFIHSKRRAHPQSSARYYALDKLKLLRLHTPSVLHALHYLSNLRHLELVSCYLYAFEEHVERTEHLHLTSLHLNPKDIHFLANLDPLLAPGSLKYLRFSGRTPFMSGELQYNPNKLDGFLLGAGSSLEELSIVWEHPCMWASDVESALERLRPLPLHACPGLRLINVALGFSDNTLRDVNTLVLGSLPVSVTDIYLTGGGGLSNPDGGGAEWKRLEQLCAHCTGLESVNIQPENSEDWTSILGYFSPAFRSRVQLKPREPFGQPWG